MWARQVVGSTNSQSPIPSNISSKCWTQCNDCLIGAQRVGKTPALCDPASQFQVDYTSCTACLQNNNEECAALQILPNFTPYLEYCGAEPAQLSGISSQLSQLSLQPLGTSSIRVQASCLGLLNASVPTTTMSITQTPSTVAATLTAPNTSGTAGSPEIRRKQASNHSWIVGAVIGPVFCILAAVFTLLLIRKRRKERANEKKKSKEVDIGDEPQGKAQLHADDLLPPQELHGEEISGRHSGPPSVHRTELAVLEPTATELSVLEPAGTELPVLEPVGSELAAKHRL